MSPFRLPKLGTLASKFERLRGRRQHLAGHRPRPLKYRSLQVDPLEERQLLSLAPADWQDTLVNSPYGTTHQYGTQTYRDPVTLNTYPMFIEMMGDAYTDQADSLSVDNDGDFVAAWTREEFIMQLQIVAGGAVIFDPLTGDPAYQRILDTRTGGLMVDYNIYARYFTDEVQRIVLPADVTDPTQNDPSQALYSRM